MRRTGPLAARYFLLPALLMLGAPVIPTANALPARPSSLAAPDRAPGTRARDVDTRFDGNEIDMAVTNVGAFGWNFGGNGEFVWPKGTGRTALYAAGLWVGARVGPDTLVTTSDYLSEYAAGPLNALGQPVDPSETDPAHRVFKIATGDGAANPDYAQWPSSLGAPVTAGGQPRVIGDQTLWCVFNDAVAARHGNAAGATAPLGLEIRQTVAGFNRGGGLGRTVFLTFDLHNKGANALQEAYVGLWFDPDLGGPADDLVGCDSTLDLGYVYNATNDDPLYGAHPPALGCAVLQGPVVAGDTLGMTAFGRLLKNATEPTRAGESYERLAGILPDLRPGNCGAATTFEVSGDPLYETGCLDDLPADRRFMVSTGPFDLAPGDSQQVVIALIVGGLPNGGTNLTNLRRLRQYVLGAREAVRLDYQNVPDLPEADPGPLLYLAQTGTPMTLDASASRDADGAIASTTWDFGDGDPPGTGAQVQHTYDFGGVYDASVTVTDDDGNVVTERTRVDVYAPGAALTSFADATFQGIVGVEYQNLDPSNRRALAGVPWGGRFYEGGIDDGCRWMGSTIVPDDDDLALCAGAALSPRSFRSVEIRFNAPLSAYRYFRRELGSGAAPAAGRGYTFQNRAPVPFHAMGIVGDREIPLEVLFTERQITDDAGNPAGAQPGSQDGTWMPTADDSGGHEYIEILALPYSFTARPELAQDGVFASGTLPVLYAGWLRLRGTSDVVDPLDRLTIRWGDLAGLDGDIGAEWADADGDGDLDLAIANFQGQSRVYRNEGEGAFSDVLFDPPSVIVGEEAAAPAASLGVAGESSASWADVDNDGDLDLYLVGTGRSNRLFRNLGGSFKESTPLNAHGNGLGVEASWVDDDRDGDLDLYLAQTDGNRLLRNHGGTLVEATPTLLAGEGRPRWADVDGDGDLDLYLVSGGPDRLLRNDGSGFYVNVTSGPIGELGGGRDGVFGDFDRDGDPDFVLLNLTGVRRFVNQGGAFTEAVDGPLAAISDPLTIRTLDFDADADLDLLITTSAGRELMRNDGGTFGNATALFPAPAGAGWAVAAGDFDADGDVDLYLPGEGESQLVRNDTPRERFLRLGLRGQISNRFAVGARVRVVAGGVTQTQDVSPRDVGTLVFGLAGAAIVDTLTIRWPSGLVERRSNVAVFSDLTLTEGNAGGVTPTRLAFGRITPNPSRGALVFELQFPAGPTTAKLGIFDVAGRRVWHRDVNVVAAGVQLIPWNGNDDDGHELPSAVYFARIEGPGGDASRRFVRIK